AGIINQNVLSELYDCEIFNCTGAGIITGGTVNGGVTATGTFIAERTKIHDTVRGFMIYGNANTRAVITDCSTYNVSNLLYWFEGHSHVEVNGGDWTGGVGSGTNIWEV